MNPKLQKWLVRSVMVCALLAVIGYGFRDFLRLHFRAHLLGLLEISADEFGYLLPEIDEIEIFSLEGRVPNPAPSDDTILGYRIHARATVRADQAVEIADLWREQRVGRHFTAICHNPGFALRFLQDGKSVFETTVCWECHNYTLPVGFFGRTTYGFDAGSDQARELLELLQAHAPLPEEPGA